MNGLHSNALRNAQAGQWHTAREIGEPEVVRDLTEWGYLDTRRAPGKAHGSEIVLYRRAITVDVCIAEIRRREAQARERYQQLDRDPMMREPAGRSLAVANAMRSLRETIEAQRGQEDRDS